MGLSTSLRTRLAALIALIVALLSWLLGSFINADLSQRLREESGRELVELAYQMGDRLDRDMATRAAILEVFAQLDALREPRSREEQMRLLDQLGTKMPALAWIGLLDPEGTVSVGSNRVLEGVNISHRPVYREALNGLFIGDVHEALLLQSLLPNPSGETMKFVDISWPIRDADDQLLGVLAAHLSWSWAGEISRSLLRATQQRRGAEFFVLAADGSVLLGPKGWIGQQVEGFLPVSGREPAGLWRVVEWPGEAKYLTAMAFADGHEDYAGLGWVVVARQPLAIADQPADDAQAFIFIAGSLLALVFAIAGWLLSSYLTAPLKRIAKAADRLSAGQYAQIPVIKGVREIETLGASIRHLVDALGHQESRLDEMSELALTDSLTGLANRAAFERFLHRHDGSLPLALLFLDLDGFKKVNDEMGHAAGDELLVVVAERLQSKVREGDLLVRLGGDEFVILLAPGAGEIQRIARQLAERILKAVSLPVMLEAGEARVFCSIGGAFWPEDGATPDDVLECADKALYRAKAKGKNVAVFSTE
ncbi:GGDEF domain-containing protein [uncultured Halopseudomonas sp.]|uniref:sensor domain-containing diguanylate cyclase n=1 Tax=uncultured Halopseudomonas sp. TaxID=2901193 RepID=UPI0030EB21A2|tara:strand:+ start:30054 stop:31667 length:1614 start_codon:yes stop_codon:yes gene_type:complete